MAEAFDTLQAARELTSAGLDRDHAEAIAKAIRQGHGELVTKSDLKAETADLKAETADLKSQMAELKTEISDLKSEFKSDLLNQQRWFIGVLLATQALLFAALRYLG